MEESRLKPMVEDYNPVLFNEIYGKTEGLRRKLASGIDHRRFGVDREEILSWFDVKFIFAYNKYVHRMTPEILLAHMITSMQLFKCRILRKAYTHKFSQSIVEFTGNEVGWDESYDPRETDNYYMDILLPFIKSKVSDNAFILLELKLNPPPYILHRLKDKKNAIHKIPAELILEYYGLGSGSSNLSYIKELDAELEYAQELAKDHFRQS